MRWLFQRFSSLLVGRKDKEYYISRAVANEMVESLKEVKLSDQTLDLFRQAFFQKGASAPALIAAPRGGAPAPNERKHSEAERKHSKAERKHSEPGGSILAERKHSRSEGDDEEELPLLHDERGVAIADTD